MSKPKRIYLQTEKDIIGGETTWCSERINEDDEEYVRLSDLVAGGVVEVEWVEFVLRPVEPTREILQRAHDGPLEAGEHEMTADVESFLIEMYRAMIGAKP